MDWNNPKFKKLQKKWYSKIQKLGFNDAEDSNGNLKVWASTKFTTYSNRVLDPNSQDKTNASELKLFNDSKQEYYRLASQYFWEGDFKTSKEKFIWGLHSEGLPHPEVAAKYNKKFKTNNTSDMSTREIIYKHQKLMKQKYKIYE